MDSFHLRLLYCSLSFHEGPVMPKHFHAMTLSWWYSLPWRHNGDECVSNHQPYGCLLNRLFGRWSKKTSKLRVTGLCVGNSPGPVNSPHKGPVTRKMFPFADVIMFVLHPQVFCGWHRDAVLPAILFQATQLRTGGVRYGARESSPVHRPGTQRQELQWAHIGPQL